MNYQERLEDITIKSDGFPQSNIQLSQKVYADLVLAKKWKNVDYKPVKGLDICVLIVDEPEPAITYAVNTLIILPILQDKEQLSLKRITEIFELLSTNNILDTPIEKFTLAIYSSDSTIVYYHISKHLVKPTQRNK